jgi:hypothetical protein
VDSNVRASLFPPLPRGGVTCRFHVEKIDERHRDDTAGWFKAQGYRWVLIFAEGGEARGFRTIAQFKAFCHERWGVTRWYRDSSSPDWSPEDGDSWVSRKGELWPGRVAA